MSSLFCSLLWALFVTGQAMTWSMAILGFALGAVALDGLAYAQRNMGPGSPNPAGSFPGIDSGTLIDGLHVTPHGPLHQTLDSSADYSIYLEYGTTRMGARPFMRPTARYMSQQAPRIVATVIGRHIR